MAQIVKEPAIYVANYKFDFVATAGTALLISSILSTFVLGVKTSAAVKVFKKTCKQLVFSVLTIAGLGTFITGLVTNSRFLFEKL